MRGRVIIGVLLILVGVASLVKGGFFYSHRKTDIDAGPLQISHVSTRYVPIGPVASAIVIVAGLGLVVGGAKSR